MNGLPASKAAQKDAKTPGEPAPELIDEVTPPDARRSFGERLQAGVARLFGNRARNGDATVRGQLEELIEERETTEESIDLHERALLANILKLRNLNVADVMVPRADIVAADVDSTLSELVELLIEKAHSRLPVYRDNLDEVIGMVHIKDVLGWVGRPDEFDMKAILRKPLFVAPSMPAPDLLLEMREIHTHMGLVVDEFGGIDGLVTIEDLVEEIVGDIQDEHDISEGPLLVQRPDGGLDADARCPTEELEALIGPFLTAEEREEDIDTLGGLIFSIVGRVPGRGELVPHDTGLEFEVVEADPRRVKRLHIRRLPATGDQESAWMPPAGAAPRKANEDGPDNE